MTVPSWLKENSIFECVVGSQAYGLATPESDVDYRGVVVPPAEYFFALKEFDEQNKWPDGADRVFYSLKKFLSIAAEAGPNALEILFVPEDCVQRTTPAWEKVFAHRDIFLTQKARGQFRDFAFKQFQIMKGHVAWRQNPPQKAPVREDFGLPPQMQMQSLGSVFKWLENNFKEELEQVAEGGAGKGSPLKKLYANEHKFLKEKHRWKRFAQWQRDRNPVRRALEEKFGYDTKQAANAIRPLIYAISPLCPKTFSVRPNEADRDFLRAVREGAYQYEEVLRIFEELESQVEEAAKFDCELPESCDMQKVEELLVDVTSSMLSL